MLFLSVNCILTGLSGLLVMAMVKPSEGPHHSSLYLWRILITRMFVSSSANLRPMQLRAPWPKGMWLKG